MPGLSPNDVCSSNNRPRVRCAALLCSAFRGIVRRTRGGTSRKSTPVRQSKDGALGEIDHARPRPPAAGRLAAGSHIEEGVPPYFALDNRMANIHASRPALVGVARRCAHLPPPARPAADLPVADGAIT